MPVDVAAFAGLDEIVDRVQQRLAPLVQQKIASGERDERAVAEILLDDVLATVIKEWAGSGRPFLDFEQEQAVKAAVLAEMFGLGRLEALLADDEGENIDILRSDPGWLSYH